MKKINKKGMTPGDVTAVIASIALGIFVIVVFAIMLGALQDDQTAGSLEYNITGRGLTFIDNATSKFGTAGTIVGVLLLLGLVGLAGFGGYKAYQRARG